MYDAVAQPLRVQIVHVIREAVPEHLNFHQAIHDILCREYGVFELGGDQICRPLRTPWLSVANFLLATEEVEQVLDVVELYAKSMGELEIAELNQRFREHGVGYEFVSCEIIRIDSQLVHSEVVKPALKLLSASEFSGPNDEFLRAHEHYRHGRNKECLNECLKAFESTMKTICTLKNWTFAPNDAAKKLIDVCISKGLFPSFLESHLGGLRSILESGVPTVRNKQSGHGQGAEITTVADSTARFALHLTATNILLLIESANEQK